MAPTPGTEGVEAVAGREHRAAFAFFIGRRIEELELHLGRGKGDAIELEVAQLLNRAVLHRHMGNDPLPDVGLPDADDGRAIGRRRDEAGIDGERSDSRREVAAVARPVDHGRVDRHLAEQIVDIAVGPLRLRQDDDLAGARGRAAHAVGVLAVAVGAADHPQQHALALGGIGRQIFLAEEHALAGAATHVDGRDAELLHRDLWFGLSYCQGKRGGNDGAQPHQ
jgi:hypothetical protein